MLKKTITYIDFDGNEVTDDYYFNISTSEIAKLELEQEGGLAVWMQQLIQSNDRHAILATFERIIQLSYGVRSEDGKRFMKGGEHWLSFYESNAYDVFFLELITDTQAAAAFINAIVPADLQQKAQAIAAARGVELPKEDVPDPEPWVTQDREPTPKELMNMTKEQMAAAMRRRIGSK